MNALLVHPDYPDTFWSFKHALRLVRKDAALPPLGLLTVASLLPRGWPKRLVDMSVSPLTDEDLTWADCVFVGGMGVQRRSAMEILARAKEAHLPAVAGGPLFAEGFDEFEGVDHVLVGEGEVTLPPFLESLKEGRAEKMVRASEYADMERSPVPLWELIDLRRYHSASIQFSRGCPYDCEFCNITALFGRRPRTKHPQQIIAELDRLLSLGWRGKVFFADDNLIGHRRDVKQGLLPALIEWQRWGRRSSKVSFSTQASINLADDDELMRMMVEAGFETVFVGIETPDEESLMECNKQANRNRDLAADVRRIQANGLQVQAGFIVGFDHDRPSIFQQQIDFIQSTGIVTAMVGMLQAMPGTRLWERMRREGRLTGWSSGDNLDGTTNIIPRMDLQTLRSGYERVMASLYAPGPYYERVRTFLKQYRPSRIKPRFNRKEIGAFLRSIYVLGIRGKERMHYWKLLGWTLFRRPLLLPLAVTLSVYGHHFARVADV